MNKIKTIKVIDITHSNNKQFMARITKNRLDGKVSGDVYLHEVDVL